MSKSCWQPSHFHMAVFPPKAARLWRMVTHAWAVIISHAGVSSGFLVLPCCFVVPQLGADLQWCWRSRWSRISAAVSSTSAERTGIRREHTQLATRRHSSTSLCTVHRNSLSHGLAHTHTFTLPPFSISLTLTAATTTDDAAAAATAAAAAELFPALLTLDFSGNSFLCALFLLRAALCGADKRWKQIYLQHSMNKFLLVSWAVAGW